MGSRFTIDPPDDFVLARDVCSYGYFLLAPNRWDPFRRTFTRPLDLEGGVATLTIAQPDATPGVDRPAGAGSPLRIVADRALSRRERSAAGRHVARMLRLDEDVRAFHLVDPRWASSGRGRLFRGPTLFEDVVKTVTSCNVTWPGTVRMNRRLCEVINPAFPSPGQLARRRPETLRARCAVGYRDRRLVELARLFASGAADAAWFEAPERTDDELRGALLELPGVGPYAAANIMQLLGRYSRIAFDTESVRHGRATLGMTGEPREIEARLMRHYEPFGDQRFRSYWFELLAHYEAHRGPAWTWDPDAVGASFTAAKLNAEAAGVEAEDAPGARAAGRRIGRRGGRTATARDARRRPR